MLLRLFSSGRHVMVLIWLADQVGPSRPRGFVVFILFSVMGEYCLCSWLRQQLYPLHSMCLRPMPSWWHDLSPWRFPSVHRHHYFIEKYLYMRQTQSWRPRTTATGSVFTALSVLPVILRFVARRIKRAQLGWDDWTILAALVMFVPCGGIGDDRWVLWCHLISSHTKLRFNLVGA